MRPLIKVVERPSDPCEVRYIDQCDSAKWYGVDAKTHGCVAKGLLARDTEKGDWRIVWVYTRIFLSPNPITVSGKWDKELSFMKQMETLVKDNHTIYEFNTYTDLLDWLHKV